MRFTLTLAVLLFWMSFSSFGQSPFNGISVQEVAIDASIDIANDIEANMPLVDGGNIPNDNTRCWRVYVCMDQQYWELQVLFGDNTAPWALSTTTSFYQASNGGLLSNEVNPGFFPFEPASVYDSWFTIGTTYTSTTQFLPGNINPEATFENGPQNGFYVDDIVGSSVFGAWGPGATESLPDADNKVLIAQFTTDGFWDATMNFQFRELEPTLIPVVPISTMIVSGVTINGTPGAEPDVCPIVFLPIELLSFTAKPQNGEVLLNWSTASEINNDYFTIERSLDREHWEEVVQMPGAGTSNLTNYYASLDQDPYTGMSYYRLKQTDTNGEFSHSYDVAVEIRENDYSIYPNPAQDQVSVKGSTENIAFIRLTDATGKLITELDRQNSTQQIALDQFDLKAGIYFIEIESLNGESQFERVVIRR